MKIFLIILTTVVIFSSSYFIVNEGKIRIDNERAGFMLLRGGYRGWWIKYSNGLESPYRTFKDNLWCKPTFEHYDIRKLNLTPATD